jgi:hypothetical protein
VDQIAGLESSVSAESTGYDGDQRGVACTSESWPELYEINMSSFSRQSEMLPNQITAPNCRPALRFRCAGFFGRLICWWCPVLAAVGEFWRWHEE